MGHHFPIVILDNAVYWDQGAVNTSDSDSLSNKHALETSISVYILHDSTYEQKSCSNDMNLSVYIKMAISDLHFAVVNYIREKINLSTNRR